MTRTLIKMLFDFASEETQIFWDGSARIALQVNALSRNTFLLKKTKTGFLN